MVKDFFSKPADLVLVGVSPGLMKPQCRLNSRFHFVGYCRWQSKRDRQVEREIESFLDGGVIPVLSFGSMVYGNSERWMGRLAKAWPRDRKLIVQSGWAGFRPLRGLDHIKAVGPPCHDWIFRNASVVIHDGGAGTTACMLHSGRLHVVVPHIADQGFFANEIKRLGCGIRLNKEVWPEKLANAVLHVKSSILLRQNAAIAHRMLLAENGPEAAVRLIEEYMAAPKPKNRGTNSAWLASGNRTQAGGLIT